MTNRNELIKEADANEELIKQLRWESQEQGDVAGDCHIQIRRLISRNAEIRDLLKKQKADEP